MNPKEWHHKSFSKVQQIEIYDQIDLLINRILTQTITNITFLF